MKIISFAFAGGSKYSYHQFAQKVPDFHVIEYAGRGARLKEDLHTDMDMIIPDMTQKVRSLIRADGDFILYGHSMGALIAFLVARDLARLQLKKPIKLIVSGRRSPLIRPSRCISHLPDKEFWQEIIAIGGIPKEIRDHSELVEFYLPILRADFSSLEKYNVEVTEKLSIPIDAFYGSEEEMTKEEIMNWSEVTSEQLNIFQLEGDHFFIYDHIDYLTGYFKSQTIKT